MPESGKLPRSCSLKSRSEISEILKNGRRLPGNCFAVVWQPSDRFKFAVLLSRRHGPAIRRNRIKRLFREAIRLSRTRLTRSVKMVVFPEVTDEEPELNRIRTDVCRVFQELSAE